MHFQIFTSNNSKTRLKSMRFVAGDLLHLLLSNYVPTVVYRYTKNMCRVYAVYIVRRHVKNGNKVLTMII